MTKRLRLPPLPTLQVIWTDRDLGTCWTVVFSIREGKKRAHSGTSDPALIRRLSDGAVVWRNRAAREAGIE